MSGLLGCMLAACSLIAPLDDIKKNTSGATQGESDAGVEPRDEDAGSIPDAGTKRDASPDPEQAGRDAPVPSGSGGSGGTRAQAGRGAAGQAGSNTPRPTDAGMPTRPDATTPDAGPLPDDAMCDPLAPHDPRSGLQPCPDEHACIVHDEALRNGVAPTSCEPAGEGGQEEPCSAKTDCQPGFLCDDNLRSCHQYCETNDDCPGVGVCVPLTPAFVLGTTQLTVGACLSLSLPREL